MSISIVSIHGRQVFDSRGNPTVEAEVVLSDGSFGRGTVPSGASTGAREAIELRDGGHDYGGKGVLRAVDHINTVLREAVTPMDPFDQRSIDKAMCALDGTPNKANLGANAILAISLAVAKAAAASRQQPFHQYVAEMAGTVDAQCIPLPMMNVLNGGQHAAGSTDIQEFMIVPLGAHSIAEALLMGTTIFHTLGKILTERGYATTVGDEGGYAPRVTGGNREPLELIQQAVERAGYRFGSDVVLALDVAASELVSEAGYTLATEQRSLSSQDMVRWCGELATDFPIVSIEDGLGENDWEHWAVLTEQLGPRLQLVGDDLFVTNTELLQRGLDEHCANAILIKPNQIGSLSETIDAVLLAKQHGWHTIMSHRSGETEDASIAHLAVGLGTGQIKTGSLSRSERMAKYNELLRIAELRPDLSFARPFTSQ